MNTSKERIIALQKQVRIARTALERIAQEAHRGETSHVADTALEEMQIAEAANRLPPLQGLLGHGKNVA